jgi:hypothetical protein
MYRSTWRSALAGLAVLTIGAGLMAETPNDEATTDDPGTVLERYQSRLDSDATTAGSRLSDIAGLSASDIASARSAGDRGLADDLTRQARIRLAVQSKLALRRAARAATAGRLALVRSGATPAQLFELEKRHLATRLSIRRARVAAEQDIHSASRTPLRLTTVNG